MKLQPYKNGFIYKERNKFIYRTESGTTERVYDSIKELVTGETSGTSRKKSKKKTTRRTTPEVVAETTPEEQIDES